MNKLKKSISYLLMAVMILSITAVPSFASTGYRTPEELEAMLRTKQTDFEDDAEAKKFIKEKYDGVIPLYDEDGVLELNYNLFRTQGFIVYGNVNDVHPDEQRSPDLNELLVLGKTYEGHNYPNIYHPETQMSNPVLISKDKYNTINPLFSTFESDWNKPAVVGVRFLPNGNDSEQIAHGEKIIKMWMGNLINRLPELYPKSYPINYSLTNPKENNGKPFNEAGLTLEKMIDSFQIVSPPTSKSYGLATAWFTDPGRPNGTHRSFLIAPTPELDFIAESFEYKEDGSASILGSAMPRELTLNYDIEGFMKYTGPINQYLYLRTEKAPFNDGLGLYQKGTSLESTDTIVVNTSSFNVAILETKQPLEYKGDSTSRKITYNVSGIIPEFREEDIYVFLAVNHREDGMIEESLYDNNTLVGTIPKSQPDLVMKSINTSFTESTGNLKVSGIFEMTKGPESVPQTMVQLKYTLADGTTRDEVKYVNNIELKKDVPVEFDINLSAGQQVVSVSLEVNHKRSLQSPSGVMMVESTYDNNKLERAIGKPFDFSIGTVRTSTVIEQGNPASINFNVNLLDSESDLTTNVTLFRAGSSVGTRSITLGGSVSNSEVSFDLGVLHLGTYTYSGVVNSNFVLTASNPVPGEVDLSNNKIDLSYRRVLKNLILIFYITLSR